jgi:hypothetical protein
MTVLTYLFYKNKEVRFMVGNTTRFHDWSLFIQFCTWKAHSKLKRHWEMKNLKIIIMTVFRKRRIKKKYSNTGTRNSLDRSKKEKKMKKHIINNVVIYSKSEEGKDFVHSMQFKWTKATLLSSAEFGFVRYLLRKSV